MTKCPLVLRCGGLVYFLCFPGVSLPFVFCLVRARWAWLVMFSNLSSGVPHLLLIISSRPAIFNSSSTSHFLLGHQRVVCGKSCSGSCVVLPQDLFKCFLGFLFLDPRLDVPHSVCSLNYSFFETIFSRDLPWFGLHCGLSVLSGIHLNTWP